MFFLIRWKQLMLEVITSDCLYNYKPSFKDPYLPQALKQGIRCLEDGQRKNGKLAFTLCMDVFSYLVT